MNIHEYQAKEVLRGFGVPVPSGKPAFTVEEAVRAAQSLPGPVWVVKAQIHAGGRGKGGGVKVVKSIDDVKKEAERMLGMTLVTHQTGPHGRLVKRLYIEDGSAIERELYLSALVDRATSRIAFIVSTEGGMDIEEVAHKTPEKIRPSRSNRSSAIRPISATKSPVRLKLKGDAAKQIGQVGQEPLRRLYRQGHEPARNQSAGGHQGRARSSASTPRSTSTTTRFIATRTSRRCATWTKKIRWRSKPRNTISPTSSSMASIGCMVNGAGLAMATMDIIKLYGGEPANFLDVGGGASKEKVTAAFKIIVSDPERKGILVNIFGGIMKCDIIAEGIIAAAKEVTLKVPLVVRLEGTNVELGKEILAKSGLAITSANDLADAAEKVVKAVKGSK